MAVTTPELIVAENCPGSAGPAPLSVTITFGGLVYPDPPLLIVIV